MYYKVIIIIVYTHVYRWPGERSSEFRHGPDGLYCVGLCPVCLLPLPRKIPLPFTQLYIPLAGSQASGDIMRLTLLPKRNDFRAFECCMYIPVGQFFSWVILGVVWNFQPMHSHLDYIIVCIMGAFKETPEERSRVMHRCHLLSFHCNALCNVASSAGVVSLLNSVFSPIQSGAVLPQCPGTDGRTRQHWTRLRLPSTPTFWNAECKFLRVNMRSEVIFGNAIALT